jgi:CheY-like chemotaxis protein
MNLLSNANKFTPEGGNIAVKIENNVISDKSENQFSEITIKVKDNGVGIPQDFLSRIFESFEQADGTLTRNFKGTGLGLSICKKLTELMNGKISVESKEGEGSEFTFSVKLQLGEEVVDEVSEIPEGLKVLVIDDSEDINEYLSFLFKNMGVTCETCNRGKSAAKIIQEGNRYDFIFCDYYMPEMNGIETVGELAKAGNNAPVILISAAEWSEIADKANEAGIVSHLTKPIQPEILRDHFITLTKKFGKQQKKPFGVIAENWEDKTILIIDDNDINRMIIRGLLEETEVKFDEAENGSVGIDLFELNPEKYDLILMDVQMPILDGLNATRIIRELPLPTAKTVPIVAMTANAFNEDKAECISAGMDDYLSKPLNLEILRKTLAKYLSKY